MFSVHALLAIELLWDYHGWPCLSFFLVHFRFCSCSAISCITIISYASFYSNDILLFQNISCYPAMYGVFQG